jgi:DNA-binding CsgD family transcriptional regulator
MPLEQARVFGGRERERAALGQMLDRVRQGESAVLVLRGEAGIGKTALMHYCAREASGCRVVQITAVESELQMPFAAVHQLCEPMLGNLGTLPQPQQQALRVAFGEEVGSTPDRFVVGLAVLGLLSEFTVERPLVCLVDDAQWLDEPSRQVIGFVGRRLLAESVLLLLATRELGDDQLFPALSSLTLDGLSDDDARILLASVVPGQLDEHVRERIVAETGGNPLRLLELVGEMTAGELAAGLAMPRANASPGQLEERYVRRIHALPPATQQLLLLAAADPTGDATLLWRAAQSLGIPRSAAGAAESERLLEIGPQVVFRHPLVRSAAYAAGSPDARRAVHTALAAATDREVEAERRVWHLAAAATGPDEAVALQLEETAAAAQARAGAAGAAALLARSVELTDRPERRAERALAAANAHLHAGAFDRAYALLAQARAGTLSDVTRAEAESLRGRIQFASSPGPETPLLLLRTARTLEHLDVERARETYLNAWIASFVAGPMARPGGLLPEVSRAARASAILPQSSPRGVLLDGLATAATANRTAAAPSLRRAVEMFVRGEFSDDELMRWEGALVATAAALLWDAQNWVSMQARRVEVARASGALAPLSIALNARGFVAAWCGDFEEASALIAEHTAVIEAMEAGWYSTGALMQAAYQGRPESSVFIEAVGSASIQRGAWHGAQSANWTTAILCNGLGRYADALAAAELAAYEMDMPNATGWALPEVIEAAVKGEQPAVARAAMETLPNHTITEYDWGAGIVARCRALVSEGHDADQFYAEAVARLARTPFRTELARGHLLYGEWLRGEGRGEDARAHLLSAHDMFSQMGAEAFSERARLELLAMGEPVPRRELATRTELTPQERHIARLARDGRSNAEIGAELFLSVRTIEWHLRKVFAKLGITSRRDLRDALPRSGTSPFG